MTSTDRTVPPASTAPQLTVNDLTLAFRAFLQAERAVEGETSDDERATLLDEALSAPTAANSFQVVSLSPLDQVGPLVSIPNQTRHLLKPTDLENLRVNATRGLKDKSSLMSVSGSFLDDVELLKENVVATKLNDKVKEDTSQTY